MIEVNGKTLSIKEFVEREILIGKPREIKSVRFEKPILIGGCGSSGTTLLRTMLDSHRNIACGQEISFFDRPRLFDTPLKKLHRMFTDQEFDSLDRDVVYPLRTGAGSYFGLFFPNYGKTYHDMATTDAIFRMASDTRDFLNLYFSNFADKSGKRRWAEKTPNNIFCVGEILDFFPDSKFVHVIRDGRDVVCSLALRRKFELNSAIIRWLMSVEAGIRFRGNPRYYELKYEDLVTDTENTLRKLMSFLKDDWDPQMLDYTEAGKDNFNNYGATPIFTSSIGRWKNSELDERARKALDLSLGTMLEKLGYKK